jgi:carbonic anhydrase/acetyltransferase-like protein (isoleucine patch superfamily)
MSKGPATAVYDRDPSTTRVAGSAVLIGSAQLGERVLLAEGAVLRSSGSELAISTGSAVLENSVA